MKNMFLSLIGCVSAFGAADLALLKDYVGLHPVLSANKVQSATGVVKIVADENSVGYEMIALPWSTDSVKNKVWTTPTDKTELKRDGTTITQVYLNGTQEVRTEFRVVDGFMIIGSTDCDGPICNGDDVTLSLGKSLGSVVETKEFFSKRGGDYKTITSGGLKPKDGTRTMDIIPDAEESVLMAPYCPADGGFCDPGFNFYVHKDTTIYEREVTKDHTIYDIFLKTGEKTFDYFRWEERDKVRVFKNLQYKFEKARVVLEIYAEAR